MQLLFDTPSSQLFNVFQVVQLAPDTFLDATLGLDYIVIAAGRSSEIHRHNESDNVVYVLKGRAIIILNGMENEIVPGLRIQIPRGMWHGFRTSDEQLEFISAQIPPILDRKSGSFDREIMPSPQ